MTVNSKERAWEEVNRLFPTDYEKDELSSERAGYDIYRHYSLNYYNRICDLGNRLEVIVDDVTTNIWIDESMVEDEEKVKVMVEANHATKELGKSINPLIKIEEYKKIILCVDGSNYNSNETEVKVYEGLKRNETWLASDLVASYCDNHGIKWGVIESISIDHYNHGKQNGGHFIVTAYVGKRTEDKQINS